MIGARRSQPDSSIQSHAASHTSAARAHSPSSRAAMSRAVSRWAVRVAVVAREVQVVAEPVAQAALEQVRRGVPERVPRTPSVLVPQVLRVRRDPLARLELPAASGPLERQVVQVRPGLLEPQARRERQESAEPQASAVLVLLGCVAVWEQRALLVGSVPTNWVRTAQRSTILTSEVESARRRSSPTPVLDNSSTLMTTNTTR